VNNSEVDSRNNYALVHTCGTSTAEKAAEDERFHISLDGCVKIRRTVEMYQWVEEEDEEDDDGKREYIYRKEWKDTH
jgi:hypothetical protein